MDSGVSFEETPEEECFKYCGCHVCHKKVAKGNSFLWSLYVIYIDPFNACKYYIGKMLLDIKKECNNEILTYRIKESKESVDCCFWRGEMLIKSKPPQ
ncbi:hypothetical protein SDC9_181941 [bioreactor metagenome]|uniref:Uncharacterized protein n=1 Tax=bioreactor metagenome TaxID=1076179 RepID=A0A645H629_9ZZZZ